MDTAGSTDDDAPEEELPGHESAPLECDQQARPDTRLYKKVMALNAFIDNTAKGLKPTEALVWLALFRFARDGLATVPKATVAKRLGIDEKTVSRSIRTLQKRGLVRLEYRGGKGRGCNQYRLGIAELEKLQRRAESKVKEKAPGSPAESPDKNNKTDQS